MNDPDAVRQALDDLEPGTEVELELNDGTTVAGTVASVEDGTVRLEGDQQVNSDDVGGVVEVINSEGPE